MGREAAYEVRLLGADDAELLARVAEGVFDNAVDPAATARFLAEPRNHMVVALEEGEVIGFASAIDYIHLDKPVPMLFINEVGVGDRHRRRGVGRALVQAMLEHAAALGVEEAWVATESNNLPARRLYEATGGVEADDAVVMFTYSLVTG